MRIGGALGIRINIKFEKCQPLPDNSSTEIARKGKKKKKERFVRSWIIIKMDLIFLAWLSLFPACEWSFFFEAEELTKLIWLSFIRKNWIFVCFFPLFTSLSFFIQRLFHINSSINLSSSPLRRERIITI